jgi:porphobilinogen synthase
MAYSAKYASAFYGPFREAADSAPAVRRTAARTRWTPPMRWRRCGEVALDVDEEADIVMVKPALPYLTWWRGSRADFGLRWRPTPCRASTR